MKSCNLTVNLKLPRPDTLKLPYSVLINGCYIDIKMILNVPLQYTGTLSNIICVVNTYTPRSFIIMKQPICTCYNLPQCKGPASVYPEVLPSQARI